MAFPGKYDFNYYKGDTFEFKIYPKNPSGSVFSMSQYNKTSGAKFVLSTERGSAGYATQVPCKAIISDDGTFLTCTIEPTQGNLLDAREIYVYDVEISRVDSSSGTPITYTYTLVNGFITITDQVAGASPLTGGSGD
jgi:hypothetical protein